MKMSFWLSVTSVFFIVFSSQAHVADGPVWNTCVGRVSDFKASDFKCQVQLSDSGQVKTFDFEDIYAGKVSGWEVRGIEFDTAYATYPLGDGLQLSLSAVTTCDWLTNQPNPKSAEIVVHVPRTQNSPRLWSEWSLSDSSFLANGAELAVFQVSPSIKASIRCKYK